MRTRTYQPAKVITDHPDITDWISTAEAAAIVGWSLRHAIRQADKGRFGPVARTVGGHRRVSRAAVVNYAANRRRDLITRLPPLSKPTPDIPFTGTR
jgi:hypothetical protein